MGFLRYQLLAKVQPGILFLGSERRRGYRQEKLLDRSIRKAFSHVHRIRAYAPERHDEEKCGEKTLGMVVVPT